MKDYLAVNSGDEVVRLEAGSGGRGIWSDSFHLINSPFVVIKIVYGNKSFSLTNLKP